MERGERKKKINKERREGRRKVLPSSEIKKRLDRSASFIYIYIYITWIHFDILALYLTVVAAAAG